MKKWIALIFLYLVQGLPHGFFGQAMPVLMREQGLDLTVIGLLSLLALPWALKFVWAPLLDKVSLFRDEYRRSWIILMNYCAAILLVILALTPVEYWVQQGMVTFALLIFCLNLFISTQDIATDALAVENLNDAERGIGNGVQVAGYRIGMVLAGGLLVSLFGVFGWQGALLLLAAMMVLGTLPLWNFTPKAHVVDDQPVWPLWLAFFREPDAWLWLLMIFLFKFGDAFGTQMIRPMLFDFGITLEQMGLILGSVGFAAGLFGALGGGWLVSKVGRQTALLGFLLFETFALLSYLGINGQDMLHIYLAVILEHIAGGMATAALFTVMMDRCREHSAAADYALQSCVVVIAGLIAGSLSGFSAKALGYDGHFMLSAVLCIVALFVVWRAVQRHLILSVQKQSAGSV